MVLWIVMTVVRMERDWLAMVLSPWIEGRKNRVSHGLVYCSFN
jgi:hypothetical protein